MTAAESGSDTPSGPSEADEGTPSEHSAGGPDPLGWLAPEPKTNPPSRHSVLSVRLRPEERERVERAAEALGFTASAYVRSRALSSDANIEAWRGAYQLVLDLDEAAHRGDVSAEGVHQFREAFEGLARAVFPDADEGD